MRFAHITRGKAGSQWVKDVLTDPVIFAAQGLRFHQPLGAYGMSDFAAEEDGTLVAPVMQVSSDQWLTQARADDRCVVVLRDPRDTIVSWLFSVSYSHVTEDHILLIRPPMLALDLRGKLELATYIFWLGSSTQLSWVEFEPTGRERVFRYEDLIADELGAFRAMVEHFGWDVREDDLRAAVERVTFSRRSGGRARGEKDVFSHYRSGVAGDWRNYFERDLAERLENAAPGMMRRLGYETRDDWWTAQPVTIPDLDAGAAASADAEAARAEAALARAELAAVKAASAKLLERCAALDGAERTLAALGARIAQKRPR
jgi:hypothetical protein